ncbi:branched-chain amino acid ABC transporter permease [Labrys sp. LIt4]|uniref:branched-chain amino acid ABC transporter permease n=1 Tax=Labrys sp. LIt4 TaxID=2821355 RepID=UPI001AE0B18C|nr:branched-chain amino acid ABC transporter permease [Labrys sp. LIt4]MBP0578134.1 branched-chain amino acid ABC transporter permease [Labrys sp. LIt4]
MAGSLSLPSLVRDERFVALAMVALIAVAPFVAYPFFVMQVLCFGLFACAFNLLLGYGGLLSFGHAAFFGLASYVCAHAAKVWGLTPELAILSGAVVAALLGLVVGALAIRRQGIYFAMITLGLAQMVQFYATQADFTGGEDGIQGVPRGRLFGAIDLSDDRVLYILVAVIVLAGLFAIHRIVHSPFGQVMKAIRDNEPRSLSLGYDAERFKLLMFVLSATLAGVAGATKALVVRIASLTDVHWTMSGLVVLMALVGGTGTLFGPMLGALVVVTMEHYLAPLGSWVTVAQGAVFVICVLAFRDGIAGTLGKLLRKSG